MTAARARRLECRAWPSDNKDRDARRTRTMRSPAARSRRRRLPAGLYLVATPIGNLRDITLRALEMLAGADVIACEDTRVTRKLLDHYGIATPLTPYHEHNAAAARPKLLARLADGEAVALVSDAGTPLISDPGYKLVRAAQRGRPCGRRRCPARPRCWRRLTVAGLPTDRFFFEGFLPPKDGARGRRASPSWRASRRRWCCSRAGRALAAALADLAEGLGAARGRGLPRTHQAARGGPPRRARGAGARLTRDGAETRGEIRHRDRAAARTPRRRRRRGRRAAAPARCARVSVKDAVGEVALATGRPRREVYQRALELAKDDGDGAAR